jgi:hypothetical protein
MLKAFFPLRVIAAVLQAQYGETLSHGYLCEYKRECRIVWRLPMRAKQWTPKEAV